MNADLASLAPERRARAGELDVFARTIAHRLARMAGEGDASRIEVFAHVVRAVQEGHTCLTDELLAAYLDVGHDAAEARLADAAASSLVAHVTTSIDSGPEVVPFVVDERGRLYLRRHFDHQQRLARRLVALASSPLADAFHPSGALVETLFPDGDTPARRAALRACAAPLTILTGGPGTGKTSTVVKVLALVSDAALSQGRTTPRVALLAPTGKAAARLAESIATARDRLCIASEVRDAIASNASTVHRALGVRREGGYRHDRSRPLDADLVIVDEASMVDLALMDALVDAVPPHARLVLLGDRDQLASVEAGSVLADVCEAAEAACPRLAGALITLTTSHRFDGASGIGKLARAVRDGDADAALATLASREEADVVLGEAVTLREDLPAELSRLAEEGYAPLARGDDTARLAALSRFRILTPLRRGALGVEGLGGRVASLLGHAPSVRMGNGTPVIVVENAPEVSLSNGDMGVVVDVRDSGEDVAFDGPRRLGRSRLPRHEPAFVMSIHKSQGSEFDTVAVVLPERSPLSTRELLYTAITRAKRRVFVFASEDAIRAAIGRRIVRSSGLVDALANAR